MERIILFGASRGGMNFIKNNKGKYEILAVADNDEKKWENKMEGIKIINPSNILFFSFDKVMITSMFFNAINTQLLNLGIAEEKIDFAPKNSMKVINYPFSEPKILNKAIELIGLISELLKEERYYFTFGSCLGIVRDGKLIPWDDDIDIAIHQNDVNKIKEIFLANSSRFDSIIENKMYLRQYENNQPTSISIDCMMNKEFLFNINLDCFYEEDEYAKSEIDKIPMKFFQEPSEYKFKEYTIKLPTNFKDYLTCVYRDWQVIRKNTTFVNNTTTYVEPTMCVKADLIHETIL